MGEVKAKIKYLPNTYEILEKEITLNVLFQIKNTLRKTLLLEC